MKTQNNMEAKKWKYKTLKKVLDMWAKQLFTKAKLSSMDTELKIGATKRSIRAIGIMDYNRDKVSKIGCQQNHNISEDGVMASNMIKVSKHGTMAVILMVNGFMMLSKEMVHINGPIKEYTQVNGKTINYMEAESLIGLMVVHTPENMWMT